MCRLFTHLNVHRIENLNKITINYNSSASLKSTEKMATIFY